MRGVVKGLIPATLLASVIVTRTARSQVPALRGPCQDSSFTYSTADTSRGVIPASAITIQVLPRPRHNTPIQLRILVSATAIPESIEVIPGTDTGYVRTVRDNVRQWRFRAAMRGRCTVPYWYGIRMQYGH
jgi:hypothetical protein